MSSQISSYEPEISPEGSERMKASLLALGINVDEIVKAVNDANSAIEIKPSKSKPSALEIYQSLPPDMQDMIRRFIEGL